MANIRIVSVGKFNVPSPRPYYVGLEIEEGKPPMVQPMNESEFFRMVNAILEPVKQACGMTHAHCVTIPDDQLEKARNLPQESKIVIAKG